MYNMFRLWLQGDQQKVVATWFWQNTKTFSSKETNIDSMKLKKMDNILICVINGRSLLA